MYDKILKLTNATAFSMPDDPDAGTDIDKKNNAKRKQKDKDGGVTGVDATGDPKGSNGTDDSKVQKGYEKVFKGGGMAHPGFDTAAQRIADKENVPIARAKAILAAGAHGASSAAKKRNPRLKRV